MKIKINPYLYSLIKSNILYIISFFFVLIFLFLVFVIGLNKTIKANSEIKKISEEIKNLKKEVSPYNYDEQTKEKINESIKLLNSLIPDIEDYFSIIYALENLSRKTGFMIVNYSVDVSQSTREKIKLSVGGVGDSQSFLNFLDQYNFGGGRLITSDRVEYNSEKSGIIKINLTFYNKDSKKISSDKSFFSNLNSNQSIDNILKDIEKIKEKTNFNLFFQEEENVNFDYPKKSNPFK
ncbi:MAG: hypothetical protein NZM02_00910 [Patescibacteria group bacterium]|nr:hypothetical protein [Patescibacteria group bacterium]